MEGGGKGRRLRIKGTERLSWGIEPGGYGDEMVERYNNPDNSCNSSGRSMQGANPCPSAQFERIKPMWFRYLTIFLLLIGFCWLLKSAFLSVYASVKKAYRDYKKIK